jgi:hypothetical protein
MLTFPNLPFTPDQHRAALAAADRVFRAYSTTAAECWPHVLDVGNRRLLRAWYAAEDAAVRAACKSWRGVPPGARMDWEPNEVAA